MATVLPYFIRPLHFSLVIEERPGTAKFPRIHQIIAFFFCFFPWSNKVDMFHVPFNQESLPDRTWSLYYSFSETSSSHNSAILSIKPWRSSFFPRLWVNMCPSVWDYIHYTNCWLLPAVDIFYSLILFIYVMYLAFVLICVLSRVTAVSWMAMREKGKNVYHPA